MEQKRPSDSAATACTIERAAGGKINSNQSFECKTRAQQQIQRSKPLPTGASEQPSGSQIMSVPSETDVLFSKKELESVYGLYKSISYNTGIPKGKPKSGRKWKTEQTTRFSDVKKDKPLKTSWEKKMKEKAEKKSIKMYERQLRESREQEIQKKKERKASKLKRKLENERKSEVVQVIRNTAKLKRMKKKQLRQLEKR